LSPSGGERTHWEKFFLIRHSQRVTFFFDTFADKSETSGLGECLRFPAAWYTRGILCNRILSRHA